MVVGGGSGSIAVQTDERRKKRDRMDELMKMKMKK